MAKKTKKSDALTDLLEAASHKVLAKLIFELATEFPEVRRECFDFLKSQISVSKALKSRSEGEAILALWSELGPDLNELDSYGGGDYATEDLVAELLEQIRERLDKKNVDTDHRHEILNLVLPYIKSGNAGMDDMLYEVAYAACYDDDDLRVLAQAFEVMPGEWKLGMHETYTVDLGTEINILSCALSVWNTGLTTTIWPLFIGTLMRRKKPFRSPRTAYIKHGGAWMSSGNLWLSGHRKLATGTNTCNFSLHRPQTG
jgi:hypothetical protein